MFVQALEKMLILKSNQYDKCNGTVFTNELLKDTKKKKKGH